VGAGKWARRSGKTDKWSSRHRQAEGGDLPRSRDRAEAEARLERFLTGCRLAAIPSFDAFADGIRLWREELLAYFDQPITNGYAEGVINKIKVIKRRAYGLPTFDGFRRRVLVACASRDHADPRLITKTPAFNRRKRQY
jgi:transposase